MMVLVDTNVWSLALRRPDGHLRANEEQIKAELAELINEARAQVIGPVRQELLSGIRTDAQFERLLDRLRAFDNATLRVEDYEEAARIDNRCRANGIAGSPTDFLICAVALRRNWQIFTTDADFARYAEHVSIPLYVPRSPR